jgi:hypothetical protein
MLSWLLWALDPVPVDPLLLARLVLLFGGLGVVAGGWLLLGRLGVRGWLRPAATATAVPVLTGWSVGIITPDVLVTAVLLGYLCLVTSPRLGHGNRYAALVGVTAGIGYLTKAFFLPFFLVHLTLLTGWHLYRSPHRRRAWIVRYAVALGAFAAVSVPWIAALTAKYGHLTYSTAPEYNWRIMGPAHNGLHPTYTHTLLEPSGPHALTAWQDPTLLDLRDWSLTADPGHFLHLVTRNTVSIVAELERATLFAGPVLLAALVITLRRRSSWDAEQRHPLAVLALAGALTVGGYAVVKVQPQYLWPALALILLVGTAVVAQLGRSVLAGRRAAVVALAGLLYLSYGVPVAVELHRNRGAGSGTRAVAERLRAVSAVPQGRPVASNTSFRETLFLSYHRGLRYYGMVPATPEAAERQLADKGIEYYFYWGEPEQRPPYLRQAPLVFADPAHALLVYRLR